MPLLTKAELQSQGDSIATGTSSGAVTEKVTGGSTGEPVRVLKDAAAVARERAATWMAYGWYGLEPGDRAARFWGDPRAAGRRLRYLAADVAMHRLRFSAFAFDEERLEDYWRRCLRFRPRYFYGYVSMLTAFARYLRDAGHEGRRLGLTAVITTSEVLADTQRRLLAEVFGAPVRNEYGCGEVGPVAYECPEGSLHLMTQNLVVELLREDGSPAAEGESGEIVLTDLTNYAMPLIRYRVGDYGVAGGRCACGRSFPVLADLWGRQYDLVETPEGRRFHGEYFMYLIEDLQTRSLPIRKFQFLQSGPRELQVRLIVPEPARWDEVSAAVRRELARDFAGWEIEVEFVEEIPRAPSGKMRLIRNLWKNP